MKYSEGLVLISSRSSSACVEGRARQGEQLGSLRYGQMATWPELVRLLRQRGLVGRDASYEEALCERNRFGERRFI